MQNKNPESEQPPKVNNEDLARGIGKFAAVYSVGLAIFAFAAGSGELKAKEVYRGVESYLASDDLKKEITIPVCSENTQEVTVKPGDNQWALEEKHVKGIDLVLRSELETRAIEQHPGDGVLEPGDKVIMPERCWREAKQRN